MARTSNAAAQHPMPNTDFGSVQGNQAGPGTAVAAQADALDNEQSMPEDVIMAFLEGAEQRMNFHQAELIRLACQGFTARRIARAQYVLDRALQLADTRPATLPIEDSFNDYVMDFIENADTLTYHEAEFLRRVARGCNREELLEANYLLARARRLQEEESPR